MGKKGVNHRSLKKCRIVPTGNCYARRLICISSRQKEDHDEGLRKIEHYLKLRGAQPERRPSSYYVSGAPECLYVIIEDTEHIWNLVRGQAIRYGLLCQRLEAEGEIPPPPEELASSLIAQMLEPILRYVL